MLFVYACALVCAQIFVRVPLDTQGHGSSSVLSTIFLHLSLNLEFTNWLYCDQQSSGAPPASASLMFGLQAHIAPGHRFSLGAQSQTQVFIFVQQAFSKLRYLPSP